MKPQAISFQKHIKLRCLFSILISLSFLLANAQSRRLKPSVYENYIRPNATVKVQTMEGQRIEQTKTSSADHISVEADKKSIIKYQDKITVLDNASFQKFKNEANPDTPIRDLQVIPELYVNPMGGQSEATAYRIVFTLQQPFTYSYSLNKFIARLAFLLISESGDYSRVIDPVKIEVRSDEIDLIKPKSSFEINHLSLPSYDLELEADKLNDSVTLKVLTVSNIAGYPTHLKVEPGLEISSNRKTLQGLGVQEIPITVRFVGSSSSDSVTVSFSPEKGTIKPISLNMSYNRSATVTLRSEGTGKSKITAIANSYESNELNFIFIFPWPFLLFAILGGLAGSYIKPDAKSGKRNFTVKKILVGIITGIIGAGAYYFLGINLLGLSFGAAFNEIAVFIISALFAYAGLSIPKPAN
ncbi:MAG TPA: hypothetical protein VJ765_02695 [Chitinophagaceae bacterium]|nr:hypothetical protein [Chitinophagaceae bacterium]